ncbi:MAG: nucleotidyltransferase domain-containing protein [Nanoarchaeota archaeon]|nr:nucleotidyltransferase domain-containing protein [Nanoarchaeota archaeon]
MTSEKFLKLLELESKKLKQKENIFDIILYGSYVKGKRKPNDIDIMIIFNKTPINQQLELIQKFKERILKTKEYENNKLDIKAINLKELFNKGFLSRQGILTSGLSLIDKTFFAEKLGFTAKTLFIYELKNLSNTEKTKFSFALNGRRNEKGLFKKLNLQKLGKNVFLSPIKNSDLIKEFLEKGKINYESKNILIETYK